MRWGDGKRGDCVILPALTAREESSFLSTSLEIMIGMRAFLVLSAALLLAGCNQTTSQQASAPEQSSAVTTQPHVKLPAGAACTAEIERFRAIIDSDLQTGNVGQKVYDSMVSEMRQPESLCVAGNGGGSHAALASVKSRHGYH